MFRQQTYIKGSRGGGFRSSQSSSGRCPVCRPGWPWIQGAYTPALPLMEPAELCSCWQEIRRQMRELCFCSFRVWVLEVMARQSQTLLTAVPSGSSALWRLAIRVTRLALDGALAELCPGYTPWGRCSDAFGALPRSPMAGPVHPPPGCCDYLPLKLIPTPLLQRGSLS